MFEPVLRLPIIIRRSGVFEGTQGSFVRKCSNFLSDWDKRVNVYLSYLSSSWLTYTFGLRVEVLITTT